MLAFTGLRELLLTAGFVARGDLVMTSPQQEQIGQHRDPHGVRAPLRVPTDLMLAQSQPRFEFPIDDLDRSTLLVHAHHCSRGQLRQIGHPYVGLVRAQVTPFFTQHHGDITDMTQTQAPTINSKGVATFAFNFFGNPGSLVQLTRQIGDEILDHFLGSFRAQLTVLVNPLVVVGWRYKSESL